MLLIFCQICKNGLQMESEVNILSERGIEHLLWTCRIGGWVAIKESGVVRDGEQQEPSKH